MVINTFGVDRKAVYASGMKDLEGILCLVFLLTYHGQRNQFGIVTRIDRHVYVASSNGWQT